MLCFNDNGHTIWMQSFHESVSDLYRQVFLDLQTPGENIDNAGDFGQANHLSIRNISDVSPANERQKRMFAKRL